MTTEGPSNSPVADERRACQGGTCLPCRISKVRCDKTVPCGRCRRRNVQCIPQTKERRRRSRIPPSAVMPAKPQMLDWWPKPPHSVGLMPPAMRENAAQLLRLPPSMRGSLSPRPKDVLLWDQHQQQRDAAKFLVPPPQAEEARRAAVFGHFASQPHVAPPPPPPPPEAEIAALVHRSRLQQQQQQARLMQQQQQQQQMQQRAQHDAKLAAARPAPRYFGPYQPYQPPRPPERALSHEEFMVRYGESWPTAVGRALTHRDSRKRETASRLLLKIVELDDGERSDDDDESLTSSRQSSSSALEDDSSAPVAAPAAEAAETLAELSSDDDASYRKRRRLEAAKEAAQPDVSVKTISPLPKVQGMTPLDALEYVTTLVLQSHKNNSDLTHLSKSDADCLSADKNPA